MTPGLLESEKTMSFFAGSGSRNGKKTIPVMFTIALALAGGAAVFMSPDLETDYPVVYAAGGDSAEVAAIKSYLELLKGKVAQDNEEINRTEAELKRAEAAVWKERYQRELDNEKNRLEEGLETNNKQLSDFGSELEEAEQAAMAAQAKFVAAESAKEATAGALKTLTGPFEEAEQAAKAAQAEFVAAESAKQAMDAAFVTAQADKEEKKTEIKEAEQAAKAAQAEFVAAKSAKQARDKELGQTKADKEKKVTEIKGVEGRLSKNQKNIQGLQLLTTQSSVQGGSDEYSFYLAILAVILCTALGLVLERKYREFKDIQVRETEKFKSASDRDKEHLEKVLEWEERTEGEGPSLIALDVNIQKQLDQNQTANDEVGTRLGDLVKSLNDYLNKLRQDIRSSDQTTLGELERVNKSVEIATEMAEKQKVDLNRYKEGYNFACNKAFIKGVIRVIGLIDTLQDSESEADSGLDSAKDELENLLDNNFIEDFRPELGASYSDLENKEKSRITGVQLVPAGEPVGKIFEVVSPGYRLNPETEESEYQIIQEAMVIVTKQEEEPTEEPEEESEEEPREEPEEKPEEEPGDGEEETDEGNES
jgi:hypothetical protein